MKKNWLAVLLILVMGLVLGGPGAALSYDFGKNITIFDKVTDNSTNTWYNRGNLPGEDEEVEPNCVRGQAWDLEAFFLKGSTLTMVGGFDFQNGYEGFLSGDIFLDVNGDFVYGTDIEPRTSNGYVDVSNKDYKYEYAVKLIFETPGIAPSSVSFAYLVYALNEDTLLSAYYGQNDESNPWQAKGEDLVHSGQFSYLTGLSDADTGLKGGLHNALELDLAGFLSAQELANFTAHFTMGCGNDNLMGSPVPEPATMVLLGIGLIGMAAVGRKRFFRG